MTKLCYTFSFTNLVNSSQYGDLFLKRYNTQQLESYCILQPYSETNKEKTRDFGKKCIKLFYQSNTFTQEEILKKCYNTHIYLVSFLQKILESTVLEHKKDPFTEETTQSSDDD